MKIIYDNKINKNKNNKNKINKKIKFIKSLEARFLMRDPRCENPIEGKLSVKTVSPLNDAFF